MGAIITPRAVLYTLAACRTHYTGCFRGSRKPATELELGGERFGAKSHRGRILQNLTKESLQDFVAQTKV